MVLLDVLLLLLDCPTLFLSMIGKKYDLGQSTIPISGLGRNYLLGQECFLEKKYPNVGT